ncbi:MAG: hypothetical protein J6Y98_00725 [Bacteroidales bacterium]|nr:hypothetical protein [Bacteroidales bacterium]
MKIRLQYILLFATVFACMVGCDKFEGDVSAPSYLKIDSIIVLDNPSDSWSQESGFFTCDIDAVNVTIWVDGDTAETNLGMYDLPITIPVLRSGDITKVQIAPVVRQDGIAGKRIFYPYYNQITLNNVRLQTDSVTDLGTLQTTYISRNTMRVLWREFFEPGPGSVSLDTVVSRCFASDTVRSGYGCGVIRVPQGVKEVNFWSDTTFTINDPQAILYLEMDFWSDVDFSVGLNNPMYSGGLNQIRSHMTIYGKPERRWRKIYINIGALWSKTYNHYPTIRPYFTILNNSGKPGNLFLDNIKLITM